MDPTEEKNGELKEDLEYYDENTELRQRKKSKTHKEKEIESERQVVLKWFKT